MKNLLLMSLAALVISLPGTAAAQSQWFDFNGQALLPGGVGGTLTMVAKITNNGSIETPLPLTGDVNDRYTLVIEGLELITDSGTQQDYAGGTISLYEDDGTLADFGDATTFSDGTAILTGTFDQFRRVDFGSLQSGAGTVNWTGGTRLGEIAPADQLGWAFVVSISNRATVTLEGYDENWNGKVEPSDPIVDNEVRTWGQLKRNYQ
jgi:hypothetical protein